MTKADERSDRNGSGSESGYSIGEDFETVIERIKEIRRGPPLDSRAASFDLVLMLARRMIFNEIEREKKESIRKKRQKAALHQFDKKVSLIVQEVSDCKNFEDQSNAIEQALQFVEFDKLKLSKIADEWHVDEWMLLEKYETQLPIVQELFGSKGERRFGSERYPQILRSLADEYPFLSDEQLAEALIDTPSWAVCVILGAKLTLSPDWIKRRITLVRAERRLQAGGS